MPLGKIFIASTSNAIFWQSTLAPWFTAAREGLVTVVYKQLEYVTMRSLHFNKVFRPYEPFWAI